MSEDSKPFNAEEVRTVIESLQKPVVFLNMVSDWPAMRWTIENLSQLLNGKELTFRIGKRKMTKAPQFETQCQYIQATLQEFLVWLHGDTNSSPGRFLSYPRSEYWAYADYKYVAKMFEDKAELFQDIIWSDFGFPGRDGRDSTLWIGSEAANTPCHLDSYGCNLVLQVQGRKRWHLFPPEDTCFLYPTRIPYEESSVFSSVNVVNPDLKHFPRFRRARPYVVNLCPGEGDDNEARVGEALARTVVCAVKSADSHTDPTSWLNTTEGAVTSYETNLHYVNLAVQSCLDNDKMHPASCTKGRDQSVQLSSGLPKKRKANSEPAEFAAKNGRGKLAETKAGLSASICIGPNLVPVKQVAAALEEDSVSSTSGDLSLASRLEAKQCSLDCDSKPADNVRRLISTDDLLNCLVHPDVIQLMTEILLGRHYSH
ncbi:HSPB1-associated protein 1 homolog isoform X3 [Hemitrygon akajei]|uniref:HSPB1-associated protein 1 homolog isoform X3 n=1 Tax=Hemitrygon akajei TaxID=2704970 RepID=UPI003BF9EA3B